MASKKLRRISCEVRRIRNHTYGTASFEKRPSLSLIRKRRLYFEGCRYRQGLRRKLSIYGILEHVDMTNFNRVHVDLRIRDLIGSTTSQPSTSETSTLNSRKGHVQRTKINSTSCASTLPASTNTTRLANAI